jgi:hypothetical protein
MPQHEVARRCKIRVRSPAECALQTNAMMSMVGLLLAWQVFRYVTEPTFSARLRLLHPLASYS